MNLALWPVVLREDLVRAFRPGEPAEREGPFRTLREHDWATRGVPIHTRSGGRASGRVVLYSILNVEAAICARCGASETATALTKAAEQLEKSEAFLQLKALLSECPSTAVSSFAEGALAPVARPDALMSVLRTLARDTEGIRHQRRFVKHASRFQVGRISSVEAQYVVIEGEGKLTVVVPRLLARAAHREQVGECLGVINSQVDDRELIVRAVPGIDLNPRTERYSPFKRVEGFERVSAADAAYLRGRPIPPKITIPIIIEQ